MESHPDICKQQPEQRQQPQQQQQVPTTATSEPGVPSPQLPPVLQLRILSLMPRNARVLNGRLVCRDAHRELKDEDCTASLAEPLPDWAHAWAQEAGREPLRHMSFQRKVLLLCTAAASGSEVNLEVAWDLLLPSIFAEVLQSKLILDLPDPGQAAVRAGHAQVLPWLMRHCPALLRPVRVLAAAAKRCDLAGLQTTWEALQGETVILPPAITQGVLDAAAESATADAVAKMEWVLNTGPGKCRLQDSTVEAAARSGDVGRLHWLHDRGCALSIGAVTNALSHADLSVAQWLVDEAGCELPQAVGRDEADQHGRRWRPLLFAAVKGADGVAKLRWLEERGCVLTRDYRSLHDEAHAAIEAGHEETVLYLLSRMGPGAFQGSEGFECLCSLGDTAVRLGSIPVAEALRQVGCVYTSWDSEGYRSAARRGDVRMFRWLARTAGVEHAEMRKYVNLWPRGTAADLSGLCEVMQVLLEAGQYPFPEPCNWRRDYVKGLLHTAAGTGNLAVFREVLQPGELLDASVAGAAADGGCRALLEWLGGRPGGLDGLRSGSPYVNAAKKGDRGTLITLRRLGVPWGWQDSVARAVQEQCGVPALSWLVQQGAPVGSREDMDRATRCVSHSSDVVVLLRALAAREFFSQAAAARDGR